jgi:hypothetical protein
MAVLAVGAFAGPSQSVATTAQSSGKTKQAVVKVGRSSTVILQQCSGGTMGCGGWTVNADPNGSVATMSSVRQKSGAAVGSKTTFYVKVTGVRKGTTQTSLTNSAGTTTIKIKVVK